MDTDQKQTSGYWGVLLLITLIGVPLGFLPRLGKGAGAVQPSSVEPVESSKKKEDDKTPPKPPDPWIHAARLYGDYFGVSLGEETGEAALNLTLGRRPAGYEMEFVIALVPDPLDSHLAVNFDQALEGIQQAFTDSEYLLDRLWLPWGETDVLDTGIHRQTPGLLLFRKKGETIDRLATVLLVGESPKSGIRKEAFRRAVRLAVLAGKREIRVLGPSFSGSIESLRMTLAGYRRPSAGGPLATGAPSSLSFRIASGTATGPGLEAALDDFGGSVTFCRTVVPDTLLRESALKFLDHKMGWNRGKLALLSEADTGYGQQDKQGRGWGRFKPVVAEFPSGLSDLRAAWEKKGERKSRTDSGAVRMPQRALDLDLMGQGKPLDLIPRFDAMSVRDSDLALSALLRTISRERLWYVGILATDSRDKLFLAEQIQRHCPDVLLFTMENDLLYGHPDVGEAMDGMLILSNFPLFTEGQLGLPSSNTSPLRRRQYASEYQQGTFKAMRHLLNPADPKAGRAVERQVWISAVGNGSVWPVAHVPVEEMDLDPDQDPDQKVELCPTFAATEYQTGGTKTHGEVAERRDLQLLLFMVVLYLLASALDRVALPPDMIETFYRDLPFLKRRRGWFDRAADRLAGSPRGWRRIAFRSLRRAAAWRDRLALWKERGSITRVRALSLAVAVIWIFGSVVLFLGLFPLLPLASSVHVSEILVFGLTLFYILLVWRLGRLAWPFIRVSETSWKKRKAALALLWTTAGLLLPLLVSFVLWRLWMPGGLEPFYFRVRSFAGGLSPVVPLAWLAAALYIWVLIELKRLRLLVRHAPEWPLQKSSEPVLESLPKAAEQLGLFLRDTRIPGNRWLIGTLLVLLPPLFLFWTTVQPVAEVKDYGRIFLSLCAMVLVLGGISFFRFVSIWLLLQKILQRLEHTFLIKALGELSPKVGWSPMRSFWQMPTFNVVLLSVQKIEGIERLRKVDLGPYRSRINKALNQAFEARRSNLYREETEPGRAAVAPDGRREPGYRQAFRAELAARQEMQKAFLEVGQQLSGRQGDPVVDSFFAVRIVSYVRHVFLHMRNCLIAALVCGVFTITAISTYSFEPKQFLSLILWLVLVAAVVLTIWIFVQMDRNAALSAIGGTEPGKVTFDRVFVLNVLAYGVVPLLSVVATQFPNLGAQFLRFVNPVLRVAGVD